MERACRAQIEPRERGHDGDDVEAEPEVCRQFYDDIKPMIESVPSDADTVPTYLRRLGL
jgi:hypothetical protein